MLTNYHMTMYSQNKQYDNINVIVRVRPSNEKERIAKDCVAVRFPGDGKIIIDSHTIGNTTKYCKEYSFDAVFEPTATQEDILQYSGIKRLIKYAIKGYTTSIICYGQTGSGKTYTLTGPPDLVTHMNYYSNKHGLVFRSLVYLFKQLQESAQTDILLTASFLEIYNEKVVDLLDPFKPLKALVTRWDKNSGGFYVDNLFTVRCQKLDDLLAVLEEDI